jgi:hypothetical protein
VVRGSWFVVRGSGFLEAGLKTRLYAWHCIQHPASSGGLSDPLRWCCLRNPSS